MAGPMMDAARKAAEYFGYDADQFETGLGVVEENPFSLFRGAVGAVKEDPIGMGMLATPFGRAINLGAAAARGGYDQMFGEEEVQAEAPITPLAPPPDRAGIQEAIAALRGDAERARAEDERMSPGFSRMGKGFGETPGITRTDIISAQERADAFRRRGLGLPEWQDDKRKAYQVLSKAESENAKGLGQQLDQSESSAKTERLRALIEKMKSGETSGKERIDRITNFQKTYMKALEGQELPKDPAEKKRAILQTMRQFSSILQPDEFIAELQNAGFGPEMEGPAQEKKPEGLNSDEAGSSGYLSTGALAALALLAGTKKGRALLGKGKGKLGELLNGKMVKTTTGGSGGVKFNAPGGGRVSLDEFFKARKSPAPQLRLPAP